MKRILVTGATGFLGKRFCALMAASGYEIVPLVRESSDTTQLGSVGQSAVRLPSSGQFGCDLWQKIGRVDCVAHFAVEYGRGDTPASDVLRSNLVFPLEVLEFAMQSGTKLFLATDTCFSTDYPYLQAYTRSKKAFADWAEWRLSEDAPIRFVNLVLQHPYGPGDGEGKFVPWLVKECLRQTTRIEMTEGLQQKDFIFIDDVVSAYRTLVERCGDLKAGFQQMDIGTGTCVSVREFAKSVHSICGSLSTLDFGAKPTRPGEPSKSVADSSPLRSLGWQPKFSLSQGVRQVVDEIRSSRCATRRAE